LKAAGRDRPDIKEVARLWNLLPEQERREWDNKAREEEKRYIQELRDRPDGASAEGEEAAGVSQAGDESDEEGRNLLALQLPFGAHSSRGRTAPCSRRVPRRPPHAPPPFRDPPSTRHANIMSRHRPTGPRAARVTKIIKLNGDLIKISRDACFLTARVTELFLERVVADAASTTSTAGRKTVTLRDIVTSMRGHPNPEALQAFVGAPPPPRPPPHRAAPRRAAPAARHRCASSCPVLGVRR